ncbi:MAG: hypothetical protein C4345_00690, partial [Chloroflexota bacterium]
MATIASLSVQITADTSQFVSALSDAQRQWASFVQATQNIQAAAAQAERTLTQVAAGASAASEGVRATANSLAAATKTSIGFSAALQGAVTGILGSFGRIGSVAAGALGPIRGLFETIVLQAKQMGFWVTFLVSVGTAFFVKTIVGAAALAGKWEVLEVTLGKLVGSMQVARGVLDELVTLALQTSVPLTNIIALAQQLRAFGFAAREIPSILRIVLDATAALGGGAAEVQRLALALGQIRTKGRLQAEEMRQLANVGIPAWEILAKTLGTSVADAMDMVRKGSISARAGLVALLAGLQERFQGTTAELAKTLVGRFGQIANAVQVILTGIGEEILRLTQLKQAVDGLTQALVNLAAFVRQHGIIGVIRQIFPPEQLPLIITFGGALLGFIAGPLALFATKMFLILRVALLWGLIGSIIGTVLAALVQL